MTKEQFAAHLQENVLEGTSVSNIMHLLDKWTERNDFEQATKPAIKFLKKHHHPHTKIIIENSGAEIVEVFKSIKQ